MEPASEMRAPEVKYSGLEVDFDKNITPLYQAITACKWDDAIAAAENNPEEARTWVVRHYDEEGKGGEKEIMWRFLPIHSACARQPPSALISALIKAYPDGARCVDDQGMFALHYACGNQASREVIRILLMGFPDAAKLQDPRGMLPIHYLACWGPSSISVVDMVLVANRDVSSAQDEDGNTPLDLAEEGEYDDRDAVVSALRRWLQNQVTTMNSVSANNTKRDIQVDTSDEKKEQEPVIAAMADTPTQRNMASPGTLGRLRREITTLQKGQQALDSAWEGRLSTQTHAHNLHVRELESKNKLLEDDLTDASRRIQELEFELQRKHQEVDRRDAALEQANDTIANRDTLIENAFDERDGLRQTLADLTEQHDRFKHKSELLSDRLGSLNASLFAMMDQQHIVADAMAAREDQWKALSGLRREKMKELLALDEQEPTDEIELQSCLRKQMKEMEAIQAVIAAVRQD